MRLMWRVWGGPHFQDVAKTTSPGASGLAHWLTPVSLFILFLKILTYLVAPGLSSA